MYKIDELITEIQSDEVVEIPGELSEQQKKLIEKKVLEKMRGCEESKTLIRYKSGKFPKRRKKIAILVASFVLMFGVTVFATKENEWDIALRNFMGLNHSDVLQLDGGEVVINERTTSEWIDYSRNKRGKKKELSITEITSVGDQNSAYIHLKTDYEIPDHFDEKTDYILPENSGINVTFENMLGNKEFCSYASEFTAVYEEGKLGFLISIENCENLNKCDVALKIENLYWYHDLGQHEENDNHEPEELLAEGTWETSWRYSYKSNVKTIRQIKRIETEEGNIYLTKIEISPISIRIEAIRNPKDRKLPWTTNMLEEICYRDGTTIPIETSATGGLSNGIFIDEFVDAYYFGEVLEPEEITCLKVCGKNVDI